MARDRPRVTLDLPGQLVQAIDLHLATDWDQLDPSGVGGVNSLAKIGQAVVALRAEASRSYPTAQQVAVLGGRSTPRASSQAEFDVSDATDAGDGEPTVVEPPVVLVSLPTPDSSRDAVTLLVSLLPNRLATESLVRSELESGSLGVVCAAYARANWSGRALLLVLVSHLNPALAIPLALGDLDHPHPAVREAAVEALESVAVGNSSYGQRSAALAALATHRDLNHRVRVLAGQALARIATEER